MKVIMYLKNMGKRLAVWLNRRTAYWNRSSKVIALAIFCLLFGGFSLWMLLKAFFK